MPVQVHQFNLCRTGRAEQFQARSYERSRKGGNTVSGVFSLANGEDRG
jgi:hypothetical protein